MAPEPTSREHRLADVFTTLSDTLVTDLDVARLFDDLAGACVEFLAVSAAGLMLVDPGGRLRVRAPSGARSWLVDLLEIQNDEGPCLDCYRGGQPVLIDDLSGLNGRWPSFSAEAARVGFGAVYALPMRLRDETIGALIMFHRGGGVLSPAGIRLAQGLADVATIGILQQRAVQRGADLADQLQVALTSRLVIEQAKGVLAEREHLDMAAAFELLRRYARSNGRPMSEVAGGVVSGQLASTELRDGGGTGASRAQPGRG